MFFRKKWKQLASAEDTFYLQHGKDVWQFGRSGSKWAANRIAQAGSYLKGISNAPIERDARIAATKNVLAFSDKSQQTLYIFRHGTGGWQLEQEISANRLLAGLHDRRSDFRYEWLSLTENSLAFWVGPKNETGAVGLLSRSQAGWQLAQVIPAAGLGYGPQKEGYFVYCLTLAENALAVGRVDTGIYELVDLCLIRRTSENTWRVAQKISKQSLVNYGHDRPEEGIFWHPDLALHDQRLALVWDASNKAEGQWQKTVGIFRFEEGSLVTESKLTLGSLEKQIHPYFQQGYSEDVPITEMLFADANTLFIDFMKLKLADGSWQLENTYRAPGQTTAKDKLLLEYWNDFSHGGASLLQIKRDKLLFHRYSNGCHELEQIF